MSKIVKAATSGFAGATSKAVGGLVGSIFGGLARGAGVTPEAAGATPEERALLAEQTRILREQQGMLQESLRRQNLLEPLLFEDLGITPTTDASGRITGYSRSGPQAEINRLMQERSLKALRGELPVSAAFERDRAAGRETLGEVMLRNLGPGWETSTPGMDALREFDAETDALRENIREGVLTNNEALINARSTRNFGQVMGAGQATLPFVQTGVGVAGGFSGPLSKLASDRTLQTQVQQANASRIMELITGAAKAGGYAMGGGFRGGSQNFGSIFG